jgi:hypothetical protein
MRVATSVLLTMDYSCTLLCTDAWLPLIPAPILSSSQKLSEMSPPPLNPVLVSDLQWSTWLLTVILAKICTHNEATWPLIINWTPSWTPPFKYILSTLRHRFPT